MCNKECVERFERIEIMVCGISTDMKWFKRLASGLLILIAALTGIDLSGMI